MADHDYLTLMCLSYLAMFGVGFVTGRAFSDSVKPREMASRYTLRVDINSDSYLFQSMTQTQAITLAAYIRHHKLTYAGLERARLFTRREWDRVRRELLDRKFLVTKGDRGEVTPSPTGQAFFSDLLDQTRNGMTGKEK